MEKSQKTGAQIYGYAVCLVAVITFLISVTDLVNAIMDMGDPLHAGWVSPESLSLASYEIYKMDVLKSLPKNEGSSSASYIPDEDGLKAMYEAAKADKIRKTELNARKRMIVGGLLIIICITLFITHWRWMKKIRLAS